MLYLAHVAREVQRSYQEYVWHQFVDIEHLEKRELEYGTRVGETLNFGQNINRDTTGEKLSI
jgi:hypothetical protein